MKIVDEVKLANQNVLIREVILLDPVKPIQPLIKLEFAEGEED